MNSTILLIMKDGDNIRFDLHEYNMEVTLGLVVFGSLGKDEYYEYPIDEIIAMFPV